MGRGREAPPPPPRDCPHSSTRMEISDLDGKPTYITLYCATCGEWLKSWKE